MEKEEKDMSDLSAYAVLPEFVNMNVTILKIISIAKE